MSDNINTTDNVCHDEIAELLSELHLNAPLPFLRDVKKCLIAEHIAPADDIIKFFDAIYTVSSSRAENITVSKMFSDDKEIVKSFSDVYKKSEYLHSKLSTPLSVCDVLPTASAYLKTLGITPPKTVSIDKKNDLRILLENGKRLVDVSFDKESPLPYGYVDEATFRESKKASDTSLFVPENTLLLLATSDESSFDALSDDERFKEILVASREIDSRGVLYAIISLAFGATVDLGALSCGEESLVDLIYAAHDEHVIAVPPSVCEEVTALASIYGVSLKNIAITTKEPSVKFNYHFGEISIRAGFLRRLFEYKTEATPKMSAEEFTLTEYEPLFYTRDGKDRQQLDGTVIAKGHIVSARYTSECSFTNGINTVIDTVFSLLAKGIDVRDIG
ncbi:MAG: hypothetical protein IKB23_03005, partial [Clostridia bacterium]|nr:hypothetical protein [Clostridia bacterium]